MKETLATLATEYSTSQSEARKDFTTLSTEVDLKTEEEMGTTRLVNVPQQKTEVTSQEPETTSFTTTGHGDVTTVQSSVKPGEKVTTDMYSTQSPSTSGYSTKSTTTEIVEATSEAAIAQSSEHGSTEGAITSSRATTNLAVDVISSAQSSMGPTTVSRSTENIMRETTSESFRAQTSVPASTMGPSTEYTEKAMFETTSPGMTEETSQPASTIDPS